MNAMLVARVCDPVGPRWVHVLRLCLSGSALSTTVLLLLTLPEFPASAASAFFALGFLLVAMRALGPPKAARDTRITLGEGRVDIGHAGLLAQRIYAADVIAASTARTSSGVTMALVRRRARARPLLLDLASDRDLDRIRTALRIGHFGFGEISWPVGTPGQNGAIAGGATLGMGVLATLLLVLEWPWVGIPLLAPLVPASVGYCVFLLWRLAKPAPRPRVALTRHGLLLAEPNTTITYVPYASVLDACVTPPYSVSVRTDTLPLTIAMGKALAEEREHLVAQLRSAAQRARGEGPQPAGVPPSVAALAPRDKPDREWLERLDATAAALSHRSARGAYRRPDIDVRDLSTALASPDTPAPIRAAAARVLARIAPEQASVQIARVLDEERDEDTRALLRVALEEDVDAAARVLDAWR
jgi:hypothetical protein